MKETETKYDKQHINHKFAGMSQNTCLLTLHNFYFFSKRHPQAFGRSFGQKVSRSLVLFCVRNAFFRKFFLLFHHSRWSLLVAKNVKIKKLQAVGSKDRATWVLRMLAGLNSWGFVFLLSCNNFSVTSKFSRPWHKPCNTKISTWSVGCRLNEFFNKLFTDNAMKYVYLTKHHVQCSIYWLICVLSLAMILSASKKLFRGLQAAATSPGHDPWAEGLQSVWPHSQYRNLYLFCIQTTWYTVWYSCRDLK